MAGRTAQDDGARSTAGGGPGEEPPPDGFRGIVNRGPAVVFIWRIDQNWPIVFVSDNVRQWGYEPEDLLSGRVTGSDTVHPKDIARVESEVERHLAEGRCEYTQEYRIRTASGETRWVEDRNIIIPDEAGDPRYIQGIVLDITERKRLERAVAQASLDERERIGKDLHDSLAQDLAALHFLCAALGKKAPGLAPELMPLVEEIQFAADRTHADVRKLARGLCPVELEDRELEPALEVLAERVSLGSGITCTFASDGWCSPCRDKLVASSVYRIVAEAVTNAQRHANASRIEVRLQRRAEQCVVEVEDDGDGFDSTETATKGMGIMNMAYRAGLIGGTLNIRRRPDGGTLVTCLFSAD